MGIQEWWWRVNSQNENLKHSIAGAGAGCVTSVVTCPLDVVKTRLQNQGPPSALVSGEVHYKGTASTLSRIWREEGIRGLYRGLGPTIFGYLPTWAIYFTAYDYFKEVGAKMRESSHDDWIVHILAAMSAGATSTTLTNPLWVIKTRFMTQNERTPYRYNNTLHAFATIAREEGIRGFYKGLGPSLMGVGHVAVQFPLYEKLKIWLNPPIPHSFDTQPTNPPDTMTILLASSLSKMVASMATYPHEVIRTRLQNQMSREPRKYRGIIHTFRVILAEESFRGFYKGMATNLLRTVPASAMTILTYEILVRKLSSKEELEGVEKKE